MGYPIAPPPTGGGEGSYEGVAEEEGAEEAEETEEAVLPTWPGGGQRHQ
jgi:hypothetical protein